MFDSLRDIPANARDKVVQSRRRLLLKVCKNSVHRRPSPGCKALAMVASIALVSLSVAAAPSVDAATSQSVAATDIRFGSERNRRTGLDTAIPAATPRTTAKGDVPFDSAKMMRVAELRPGMKGYGLTVFSGVRPERFDAEVVGVRHRAFPGDDMILCRLSHPLLEDIGVVAGMSGSPVFMDGKLIGAVAYGWGFSKEALAGVTPIESMLEVFNTTSRDLRDPYDSAGGGFRAYNTFMEMRRTLSPARVGAAQPASATEFRAGDVDDSARSRYNLPDNFALEPLATPLYVSSATPFTLGILREAFSGFSIQPVALGASGGGAPSAIAENSPGGPVTDLQALADELSGGYGLAIPLVEGDFSIAGVGTVSFREGDRLVAFGHPMFQNGIVAYPMAPARVNSIVRSAQRPFKLGESLGQVGIVRQDRHPAIGGVFGDYARMFPVHVSVEDPEYRGRRDFHYRVWDDREMGPTLAMTVMTESLASAARAGGDTAVLYSYTAAFDDGTTLTVEDYVVDQFGGGTAGVAAGADLGVMANNPYKRVRPVSVEFTARVAGKYPEAQLLSASVDRLSYRPGEQIEVTWELQPYRKPVERITFSVALPEDLPDGDYQLTVCDSMGRQGLDNARDPGGERIRDYPGLVRMLTRNYPRNRIYVALQDRDTGASVNGRELPRLPGSVISTLESSTDQTRYSPVRGNFLADADVRTEYEVSGNQSAQVRVSRKKN